MTGPCKECGILFERMPTTGASRPRETCSAKCRDARILRQKRSGSDPLTPKQRRRVAMAGLSTAERLGHDGLGLSPQTVREWRMLCAKTRKMLERILSEATP